VALAAQCPVMPMSALCMTECLSAGLYVASGGNDRHFVASLLCNGPNTDLALLFEGKMIDAADRAKQVISFWAGGEQRKP
jgi:hypothetical protein